MKYLPVIMLYAATYVTLTSNLQLINILFGLLIALAVIALVRPPVRSRKLGLSARSFVAGLRYIGVLIDDLVRSGIHTARLVLSPSLPVNPGLVIIPSHTETELGAALSAHAITLTPGELVVEIDAEHIMYSHALDAGKAAEYVDDAQETRLNLLDQIFP